MKNWTSNLYKETHDMICETEKKFFHENRHGKINDTGFDSQKTID